MESNDFLLIKLIKTSREYMDTDFGTISGPKGTL